jgi:hypothetical protein
MVRASFTEYTGFSLAFTRGLRWWLPAAARLDLRFPLMRQFAIAEDFSLDLIGMAASAGCEKP